MRTREVVASLGRVAGVKNAMANTAVIGEKAIQIVEVVQVEAILLALFVVILCFHPPQSIDESKPAPASLLRLGIRHDSLACIMD